MPTVKKSEAKKLSIRKPVTKKASNSKRVVESYVVYQPKKPSGIQSWQLNPLHPRSRGFAEKIKKDVDPAALSAQAEASVYKDDLSSRIPRSEVTEHMKLIATVAPTMTPAGSFRRGALTSNDIDVVIREPLAPVLKRLAELGYIKHTFSAGVHKFSGIVKHPEIEKNRHLDIVVTTAESYPFAMLYFTGSARHNIILRVRAKRLGLKLNEYGLFKDDAPMPGITSEEGIFAALNVPYKKPGERI